MLLVNIFCEVDDFCKQLDKYYEGSLSYKNYSNRGRKRKMNLNEVLTIMIFFHHSRMRTFKDYYIHYVCVHLQTDFPNLVSYNRFTELMKEAMFSLFLFTNYFCQKTSRMTGISFIDSTKLVVCHPLRISSNKVFKGLAARGKSSTGWFYGFKLHFTINEHGEIMAFHLTPGNTDDRNEKVIDVVTRRLKGKLFGDKGYLSLKLFKKLYKRGINLITRIKKNMKNKILPLNDKILLRKRAIIESVNEKLKAFCYIEHSRHRSVDNFFGNIFSAISAYQFLPSKPSIQSRKLRLKGAL